MNLKDASDDALKAELKRREKKLPPAPEPLKKPDFSALVKMIAEETERAKTEDDYYEDDDFQHYVYEAAMEAVYGPAYWPWKNSR